VTLKSRLGVTRYLYIAARVISGTYKFDRGFSRLHTELHWLGVPQRVVYKLGVMVKLPARSSASVPREIVEVHVVSAIGLDTEFADAADARRTKGPFIATQPNSTQLTQLNSVQPISAKQVSRVFVYDVMTYKVSQLGHYVH